jgi:hypothetical protein
MPDVDGSGSGMAKTLFGALVAWFGVKSDESEDGASVAKATCSTIEGG